MRDFKFLEFDRIVQLNKLAVDSFGGSHGIRDKSLIESAINQPNAVFDGQYLHTNRFQMASAYFYHISECQGFFDGSARTGFLAMFAFLKLNGCDLIIPEGFLWSILKEVTEKKRSKIELADFLCEYVTCND